MVPVNASICDPGQPFTGVPLPQLHSRLLGLPPSPLARQFWPKRVEWSLPRQVCKCWNKYGMYMGEGGRGGRSCHLQLLSHPDKLDPPARCTRTLTTRPAPPPGPGVAL